MKDGASGHDHHDHPAGRACQEVCGRIGILRDGASGASGHEPYDNPAGRVGLGKA